MKNVILLAPPAAGKGTLADFLRKEFDYDYISTGDLLREEAKVNKTYKEKLEKGELVSDEEVTNILKKRLKEVNKSYILDGFPRTIKQAKDYDEYLRQINKDLGVVIYLDVPKEELEQRITKRVICPVCKRSYSLKEKILSPKVEGICDDCGSALVKRDDDNIETFNKRYQEYIDKTHDLIDYYKNKKCLVSINKITQDEIKKEALKVLKEIK